MEPKRMRVTGSILTYFGKVVLLIVSPVREGLFQSSYPSRTFTEIWLTSIGGRNSCSSLFQRITFIKVVFFKSLRAMPPDPLIGSLHSLRTPQSKTLATPRILGESTPNCDLVKVPNCPFCPKLGHPLDNE